MMKKFLIAIGLIVAIPHVKGIIWKLIKYAMLLLLLWIIGLTVYVGINAYREDRSFKDYLIYNWKVHNLMKKTSITLTNSKGQSTEFCFPKVYLEIFTGMEGEQPEFHISARYSDMSPYRLFVYEQRRAIYEAENHREKYKLERAMRGNRKQAIYIYIKPTSRQYKLVQIRGILRNKAERIEEKIPGFTKITTPKHKRQYFLIPDGVEDESIFFSCIDGANCSLDSFSLGYRVRTTYIFNEDYLPKWKNIKSDVDELISGFTKTYCW